VPTRVNVPLRPETAQALRSLAQRELRDPRMQAQYLLEEGLRRAGMLSGESRNRRAAGAGK
jgi:hypothetical protein